MCFRNVVPRPLVFFAECLKLSRIVIYRSKVIWRIALWLGKFHLSVFLKIVWVFWLERVVPPLVIAFEQQSLECFVIATLRTNRVLRADRKADVNQTSQQSVFLAIGVCIRIWCTAGAVERRSQMFVYRPFRFSLSIRQPKACSQATRSY